MTAVRTRALEGKVALVTGGVRRIGRATALALADEGAMLVINANRSQAEASAVAREIEERGGRALVHLADVTDEESVGRMIAAVMERAGRIDILVNNAALREQVPFEEMSLKQWRRIFSVIVDGAFLCSRACIPHMVRQGSGTIVNLGGVSAHLGAMNRAHVVAAKAAVAGLTRALAVEFAAKGITVNCVVPGRIGGERSASGGAAPSFPGNGGPLVGRMGEPEEVAAMILALCLPTGRYITGQTIHVSGGMIVT